MLADRVVVHHPAVCAHARRRVFVRLAECGWVQELCVTEPSVRAAISTPARDVGVPLLAKDGRGVRSTGAGQRRRVLGLHAEAVAAARSEADPEHGLIRLPRRHDGGGVLTA